MLSVESGTVSGRSGTGGRAEGPDEDAPQERVSASGGYAPGAQVLIRDELWLVRKCIHTQHDGWMVEVTGVSSFVRGVEAIFYDRLDVVQELDPRETELVPDDSPNHRRSRLFLEAVMRKASSPRPSTAWRWPTASSWTSRPTSCARPSWRCRCATRSPAS